MLKKTICAASVLPLLGLATARAAIIAPPVVNPANGHIYYLIDPKPWTDAQAEAVSLGGHLVSINDAAENQFLIDNFTSGTDANRVLWIGLTDQNSEGVFQWTSGEPVTYTNWFPGEPNNSAEGGGDEDYVSFNWHFTVPDALPKVQGTWNDDTNTGPSGPLQGFTRGSPRHGGAPGPFHGVVEIIPEPASLGLLSCAAVALVRRRRA